VPGNDSAHHLDADGFAKPKPLLECRNAVEQTD